jgi:hypothetical protein
MYTNCSFAQDLYAWKTINDTHGGEAEFGATKPPLGAYVERCGPLADGYASGRKAVESFGDVNDACVSRDSALKVSFAL